MEQWQTEILTAIRDGYVPSFSGSIDQWAETYCDIQGSYTIKGPFDCSRSPHFKKVFQFIQDPLVREVNLIAPTRSGKTLIFEIGLLYTIATNSGYPMRKQNRQQKREYPNCWNTVNPLNIYCLMTNIISRQGNTSFNIWMWMLQAQKTMH